MKCIHVAEIQYEYEVYLERITYFATLRFLKPHVSFLILKL